MTNTVAERPIQLQVVDSAIDLLMKDQWARGTSHTMTPTGVARCIGGTLQEAGRELLTGLDYSAFNYDAIQQEVWNRADLYANQSVGQSLVSWNDGTCHSKMEALGFLLEFRGNLESHYSSASAASTPDSSEDVSSTVES